MHRLFFLKSRATVANISQMFIPNLTVCHAGVATIISTQRYARLWQQRFYWVLSRLVSIFYKTILMLNYILHCHGRQPFRFSLIVCLMPSRSDGSKELLLKSTVSTPAVASVESAAASSEIAMGPR